eukprot:gene22562-23033_t
MSLKAEFAAELAPEFAAKLREFGLPETLIKKLEDGGIVSKDVLEMYTVEELTNDVGFKKGHAKALKRAFDSAPS